MNQNDIIWHSQHITKEKREILLHQKPFILWFTGLSASGKSTLANAIEVILYEMGHKTYLLDGDNIRLGLNRDLGFSKEDRVENIRRIGEVAKLLTDSGMIVLSAFISPFTSDRNIVRKLVFPDAFIEIFVDVPLEICEQRDPKELYKKAREGKIKEFTGLDSPYEKPVNPEIHIENSTIMIEEAVTIILEYLKKHEYISY